MVPMALDALMVRIAELERQATAFRAGSPSRESSGKVDILLASLQGARVSLGTDLDETAQADVERMVDAVGHRLVALRN
jgi:hypothetical protein